MFSFLKRNCRFKFDFSIKSASVTVIIPSLDPIPNNEKFFKNYEPVAPDPTTKILKFSNFSINYEPKTWIISSYRYFLGILSLDYGII